MTRRRSARAARCSTCPASNERALEKAKTIPCDALILDLEDAVAPDAKPAAREAACAAAASRRVRPARADDPGQRRRHRVARRRPARPRAPPGPDAIVVPKVEQRRRGAARSSTRWRGTAPPSTPRCGRWSRRRTRCCTPRRSPRASERLTVLVMGTNDLAKELYAEHVPGRAAAADRARPGAARRPRDRQGDPRRRLQRREGHRRLPGRVPPGPRDGLRRQDPDPPRPGRGRQRGVRAERAGGRGRPRHPRRPGRTAAGSGVVTYNGRMIENLHVESARAPWPSTRRSAPSQQTVTRSVERFHAGGLKRSGSGT